MSVATLSGVSMRTRFIALIAGTLVLALAWYMLAFKPGGATLKTLKADVESTRAEVSQLEAKLAELQRYKAQEAELREQAARFEKALPEKPQQSAFIRQIHQIAEDSRVDWVSVSPGLPSGAAVAPVAPAPAPATTPAPDADAAPAPAAPVPALRSIAVSISAKGDFFQIEDFVARFEKLERAIKIQTFSLSGAENDLSLSLSIQVFMGGTTAAPTPPPAASAPPVGESG